MSLTSKFVASKRAEAREKDAKVMNLPEIDNEDSHSEEVVSESEECNSINAEESSYEEENKESDSELEPSASVETVKAVIPEDETDNEETEPVGPPVPAPLIKMKESDKVKHHIQDFANWLKMLCDLINEPIEMDKIKNSIQEAADICMNAVDKVCAKETAPRTSV